MQTLYIYINIVTELVFVCGPGHGRKTFCVTLLILRAMCLLHLVFTSLWPDAVVSQGPEPELERD